MHCTMRNVLRECLFVSMWSGQDDRLFEYLTDSERSSSEESAADDFAAHILRMLDYDCSIRTRKEIPFIMSGCCVDAKTLISA
jgi:hypothetical protein